MFVFLQNIFFNICLSLKINLKISKGINSNMKHLIKKSKEFKEEEIVSNSKMILKVKKPDYLGNSKWSFKHGNRTIYAKITDLEWLNEFQNRKIDVRTQDPLVCLVKITVKYDYNYELISTSHEVTKVIKINPRTTDNQLT